MCAADFTNVQPISFKPLLSIYGHLIFTFKCNQCGNRCRCTPTVEQHGRNHVMWSYVKLWAGWRHIASDRTRHWRWGNHAISCSHNKQYTITSYKSTFKVIYIMLKCLICEIVMVPMRNVAQESLVRPSIIIKLATFFAAENYIKEPLVSNKISLFNRKEQWIQIFARYEQISKNRPLKVLINFWSLYSRSYCTRCEDLSLYLEGASAHRKEKPKDPMWKSTFLRWQVLGENQVKLETKS